MTERERDELVELLRGAAGALWRIRLELSLLALPLAAFLLLRAAIGGIGAAALVGSSVVVALATRRTRGWLGKALHASRVRRGWRRASAAVGVAGAQAGRVTRVPAGDRVDIRVPAGSSVAALADCAEELAASLRAREVRVSRDPGDAANACVTLVYCDPLAEFAWAPWPNRDAASLSLWDPIPVGVDEDGETVWMSLAERNVLAGGEPGAGKSAALSLVIATAALDPTAKLWLLDGKLVELAAWAPCAHRVVGPDVDEAIGMLRELRAEMEDRYRRLLAAGQRKVSRHEQLPLHLVACDELAFYLTVENRRQRAEFAELLRDVVARGRAAGVIVVAATQKPGWETVPTALRDLFGFRLALRCNTPQASDTILGQGWATLAYRASDIAPADRGVGYLLAEDGTPRRLRTFYLHDDDVLELAERATALRLQTDWDGAPAQAGATA